MSKQVQRCHWAESDAMMKAYHDEEWGVPDFDSRSLWETLMLEGFQAGLAWVLVLRKREAFRAAFQGFEPAVVAAFDASDVDRLMQDAGIIRARAKIEATIGGARAYLKMQEQGTSFSDYAWEFVGGKPILGGKSVPPPTPLAERISKDLKQRGFKFVGPVIVYAWMQAVGLVNDHSPTCDWRKKRA